MKPEDVPEEWVEIVVREIFAYDPRSPYSPEACRTLPMDREYVFASPAGLAACAALAAVIPLIEAREREGCAKVVEAFLARAQTVSIAERAAQGVAAAIRARGDA